MIVYYKKTGGDIVGTTEGRIHHEGELEMWLGDRNEIDRLVVQWIIDKYFTKDGHELPSDRLDALDENGNLIYHHCSFKPDNPQRELFEFLDRNPNEVYKYKFDIKTKQLITIE